MYLGGVSVLYLCNVKLITVATKVGDSLILHSDCFHLVLFGFLCFFFFNETCRKHSWVKYFLGIFFSINRLLKKMKPFYTCGAQNLSHFWFRQSRSQQYKHVTVMKSCAAFMNDSPLSSVSAVTVTSSLMGYFLLRSDSALSFVQSVVGFFVFVFLFCQISFFISLDFWIFLGLFSYCDLLGFCSLSFMPALIVKCIFGL